MELAEQQTLVLPKRVHWQRENLHIFIDPEAPHWIAVDGRGARIVGWLEERMAVGPLARQYASAMGVDTAKAWLHTHDFIQALLRCSFALTKPVARVTYLGRSAYARPQQLNELWIHTNNICNLSCSHCLVSSAPWVNDWGLPTEGLLRLMDEAAALGVKRFYFTGGEPFMRKDLITLIRRITEERKLELILLTNGMLLREKRVEEIQRLSRERLRFQVSIDGASPATNDPIRGAGSFEGAVEALRFLAELQFETSIATAVTAGNLGELSKITELAHRLGVRTQHLIWLHRRGRAASGITFPDAGQLIEAIRQVKQTADRLGIAVDNYESVKRRVNGRPGVKYDLGNACWDSLCVYSDGTVYPSAALANVRSLALGSVREGATLRELWQGSEVAEAFRQATVARKADLREDPFKYLTGGGDLEHSFWFNLDGDAQAVGLTPERILKILSGPDPYYPLYTAMIQDAMWELVREKQEAINRKSGYDAPRIFHAMGDNAIHCATDDLTLRSGAASSSRSHDLAVSGEIDVRTLHSNCVLAFDVDKPRKLVREFYSKAAETPQAELCCPTAFDPALLAHIPKEVVDRFYGCGSPVTSGYLQSGERMVDLGSGAGIDCFIAAKLVGPGGRVIGVDMTDAMLEVARRSQPAVAAHLGYDVVEFRKGFLEAVPVESKSVDLVTSNCVINLSPEKPKVFAEIWRILKDHGRVVIADIVSDRPVPAQLKVNPQLWVECIVGALTQEQFLAQLQEAGFYGLTVIKKTYWKAMEGYDFTSMTVEGYKFEKTAGCQFIGQRAIYLGPMKAVVDEEGHLFPRDVAVEVCTDTAAKLSHPPYAGSFTVLKPDSARVEMSASAVSTQETACGPGCC